MLYRSLVLVCVANCSSKTGTDSIEVMSTVWIYVTSSSQLDVRCLQNDSIMTGEYILIFVY